MFNTDTSRSAVVESSNDQSNRCGNRPVSGFIYLLGGAGLQPENSLGVTAAVSDLIGGIQGSFPAAGLIVVGLTCVALIGALIFGRGDDDGSTESLQSRLTGNSSGGADPEAVAERLEEEEGDLVTEATKRLEYRDEEITGENLNEILDEIEREMEQDEESVATPLTDTESRHGPAATMAVGPTEVDEEADRLKVTSSEGHEYLSQALIITDFPDRVGYRWLEKLFAGGLETIGADVRVSFHIWPKDPDSVMDQLEKKATRLLSTKKRKEEDGKINTKQEEKQLEEIDRMREQLEAGETRVFDFSMYLQVTADSEQALSEGVEEVKQWLARANAQLAPLVDRQLDAYRSMAPTGKDFARQTQIMDLQSLGATFPFIEPTSIQEQGVLFGFHQTTNAPVIVDRFDMSGHNALITGKIGSGKSYFTKLSHYRRLQNDDDVELLIIDPTGDFGDLVDALDGDQIRVDQDTIINPLEITAPEKSVGDLEEDPYEQKIRSVMGMMKTHFQNNRSLDKGEEGVLRRAIRFAYLSKGITRNPRTHANESPTIQDVIDILGEMAQEKRPTEFLDLDDSLDSQVDLIKEESDRNRERVAGFAHNVLLGLEEFKKGGQWAMLNGHTTVDLNNRVVQFDLHNQVDETASGDDSLIMHIVLDFLFQRAKGSKSRTLVTIDEAHYMLGSEGPRGLLNTFARHSRHYNSGMTLISQTVSEFVKNDEAKEIYDQCDIRALMRHKDLGREETDALGFTENERSFVLSAQPGESGVGYSECLLDTTDSPTRRLQVYSHDLEHHAIDTDADNVWTYLLANGFIDWETVPTEKQPIVRRELDDPSAFVPDDGPQDHFN